MTNIKELKECFEEAFRTKANYIGVVVTMPGAQSPEVIINSYVNFEYKLAYYQRAYAEDLTLKNCKDIKIITCAYGNDVKEVMDKIADNCLEVVKQCLNQ